MDRAVEWAQAALALTPDDQRLRLENNLDYSIRRREDVRGGK
jgi:hypothetical protein